MKVNSKYLYDLTRQTHINYSQANYLIGKRLEVQEVCDGIILPPLPSKGLLVGKGGVQNNKGEFVEISAQKAYRMSNRVDGTYEVYTTQQVHEQVIYMNSFIKHWGHFLIDVIGRMWYVLQDKRNLKIVYTSMFGRIDGNYLELLSLIGIDESRLFYVEKPTMFDNVIIPENAVYPGKYFTKEWIKIFDRIVENALLKNNKAYGKKLYFSREHFSKNNEFGENNIEKIFNLNGYKTLYMEEMTVTQQVCAIHNADSLAMLSGSLMHNLLFAKDNTEAIICNKMYAVNGHQYLINQSRMIEYYPVDVWCSILPTTTYGPFRFILSDKFIQLCNDKGWNYKVEYEKPISALAFFFKYLRKNYRRILKGEIMSESDYSLKKIRNQAIVAWKNRYNK